MYVILISWKEFNYESNQERLVKIICPLFEKKLLYLTLFTLYRLQI